MAHVKRIVSVTVSGRILVSLTWVPATINEKEVFLENVNYMKDKQKYEFSLYCVLSSQFSQHQYLLCCFRHN